MVVELKLYVFFEFFFSLDGGPRNLNSVVSRQPQMGIRDRSSGGARSGSALGAFPPSPLPALALP